MKPEFEFEIVLAGNPFPLVLDTTLSEIPEKIKKFSEDKNIVSARVIDKTGKRVFSTARYMDIENKLINSNTIDLLGVLDNK